MRKRFDLALNSLSLSSSGSGYSTASSGSHRTHDAAPRHRLYPTLSPPSPATPSRGVGPRGTTTGQAGAGWGWAGAGLSALFCRQT
eukprot:scaffold18206_cov39-Tisochrysis_lutea.AAC.1